MEDRSGGEISPRAPGFVSQCGRCFRGCVGNSFFVPRGDERATVLLPRFDRIT